jgi:hypothetical protein
MSEVTRSELGTIISKRRGLLWIYFEDKTHSLAIYSLRGAQEAASLVEALGNPNNQAQANATLNAIAATLNLAPALVQTTLEQVGEDPYTEFICSIWH